MEWKNKKCFVLDLDGTIYLGGIPIPGAVDFVKKHWSDIDFYFLSNNTSKSEATYVARLNGMGIPASPGHILSPVIPLVEFLAGNHVTRAYVVGNDDFKSDLSLRMPQLVLEDGNPQAVILAYDTDLTYEKLSRSALHLQNSDILFLATHPDLVCPSPEGPLPDVGSMIELYATATGRRPQYIFGKPDPAVLAPLLRRYATDQMVMIGDRLSTDKKLAENAGIDFILVLSGEAKREDLEKEALQPALVLEQLGCLEDYLP